MARHIFVEEQQKAATEGLKAENTSSKEGTEFSQTDDVIISSAEMEKLFHEWDTEGKNDLCINATLAERIRQYLAYQEELDPLKTQLAERICKPFMMGGDSGNRADLYVNGKFIANVTIYQKEGIARVLKKCDFKLVLLALNNPYAPWIEEDEKGVDLMGYMSSIGGSFDYSWSNDRITLTTQE